MSCLGADQEIISVVLKRPRDSVLQLCVCLVCLVPRLSSSRTACIVARIDPCTAGDSSLFGPPSNAAPAVHEKCNRVSRQQCLPMTLPLLGVRQSGVLDTYPFDPAGLNSTTNQTKELKNGRLAVRACSALLVALHFANVSCCIWYVLWTCYGPVEHASKHPAVCLHFFKSASVYLLVAITPATLRQNVYGAVCTRVASFGRA